MLRLLGSQRLNLRGVLAARTAGPVEHPSNQEQQEAGAQQHGRLLPDVRQRVVMENQAAACRALGRTQRDRGQSPGDNGHHLSQEARVGVPRETTFLLRLTPYNL